MASDVTKEIVRALEDRLRAANAELGKAPPAARRMELDAEVVRLEGKLRKINRGEETF